MPPHEVIKVFQRKQDSHLSAVGLARQQMVIRRRRVPPSGCADVSVALLQRVWNTPVLLTAQQVCVFALFCVCKRWKPTEEMMKTLEATCCQLGFGIPGAWRRPFISPSLVEPELTSSHLNPVSVFSSCAMVTELQWFSGWCVDFDAPPWSRLDWFNSYNSRRNTWQGFDSDVVITPAKL